MRSSLAAFLPSLTLNAGSTRQFTGGAGTRIENGTVITLPNTPWSYSAGLGANLLLFDGGSRFYNLRQARAGEVAADANEVTQRYAVDLAVKQRYFDVLAARESEAAASAQVDQAEAQARTAALKLRAATATKSDSLRSEIQLRNAHLAVVQARTDLETANAALAHLLGVEENVTATELDSLPGGTCGAPGNRAARLGARGEGPHPGRLPAVHEPGVQPVGQRQRDRRDVRLE